MKFNYDGIVSDSILYMGSIGIPIPKESDRNQYVRACWALCQWQKQQKLRPANDNIAAIVKVLKEALPVLRVVK